MTDIGLTDEDHTQTARDAGLTGWRATVRPTSTGGRVVILHSPDYNPVKQTGRMVAACGRDTPDAFASALEAARGSLNRPQPQEKLH